MERLEKVVYITGQIACALIEMEAMRAANQVRAGSGSAPAYGEDAFMELLIKYPISHNSILGFLRE